jgi:hypothetical protein
VLHDQPGPAVLLDDVEHLRDARVVQPRGGAGLAHRALAQDLPLLVGEVYRKGDLLQGDTTLQDGVRRQPHRAHAAAAEDVADGVAAGDDAPLRSAVDAHSPSLPAFAGVRRAGTVGLTGRARKCGNSAL